MSVAGKTVLITGASRGIGATLAEEFARAGAKVVLSARTAGVQALAERLRAAGQAAEALTGDVTDDAHAKALLQLCRAKFGGLDVFAPVPIKASGVVATPLCVSEVMTPMVVCGVTIPCPKLIDACTCRT